MNLSVFTLNLRRRQNHCSYVKEMDIQTFSLMRAVRGGWLFLGLVAAFLVWPNRGADAQIRFNRAMPISQSQVILRVDERYWRFTEEDSLADREWNLYRTSILGVYGATSKLSMFLEIPILVQDFSVETPFGRIKRDSDGIGDMTVMARYTVWQWDRPGKTIRLSPFAALEMPSGESRQFDAWGPLPQALQRGSGSWDPSVGLAFLYEDLHWQFPVSVGYKYDFASDGFQRGDRVDINVTGKYRVWPWSLSSGMPAFVFAGVHSHVQWQDQPNRNDPFGLIRSGTTWHLAPMVQYIAKRYLLEANVMLPVLQNVSPITLKNDFSVSGNF